MTERGDEGPVLRSLAAQVQSVRAGAVDRVPVVLDVGGGSGAWAVPLARLGCAVTVVDHSPDALASLQRRAREAGVDALVTPVQGDVDALAEVAPAGGADLVLGHGLLEVVDDGRAAVAALAAATRPGGVVSVIVPCRLAAVLARAIGGRLAEATALLADPDGRLGPDDAMRRRLDVQPLRDLLEGSGALQVELVQGDGVLEGWVPDAAADDGPQGHAVEKAVATLEALAAREPALLAVAPRLHALARRTPPPAP